MSDPLVSAALEVREKAHAPFSNFKVGAALEDGIGRIHTGCNIENSTYGLGTQPLRRARGRFQGDFRRCWRFPARSSRRRHRSADPSLRRLPANPLGILRRYRNCPGQFGREIRDVQAGHALPAAFRRFISVKRLLSRSGCAVGGPREGTHRSLLLEFRVLQRVSKQSHHRAGGDANERHRLHDSHHIPAKRPHALLSAVHGDDIMPPGNNGQQAAEKGRSNGTPFRSWLGKCQTCGYAPNRARNHPVRTGTSGRTA